MPMHFMGGLFIALLCIYLFSSNVYRFEDILRVILIVIVVGMAWEIFEFYFVNHIGENPFNIFDTFSDIFFDISGGFLAALYIFRKTMKATESAVELT